MGLIEPRHGIFVLVVTVAIMIETALGKRLRPWLASAIFGEKTSSLAGQCHRRHYQRKDLVGTSNVFHYLHRHHRLVSHHDNSSSSIAIA
jgi:hypothetical protein